MSIFAKWSGGGTLNASSAGGMAVGSASVFVPPRAVSSVGGADGFEYSPAAAGGGRGGGIFGADERSLPPAGPGGMSKGAPPGSPKRGKAKREKEAPPPEPSIQSYLEKPKPVDMSKFNLKKNGNADDIKNLLSQLKQSEAQPFDISPGGTARAEIDDEPPMSAYDDLRDITAKLAEVGKPSPPTSPSGGAGIEFRDASEDDNLKMQEEAIKETMHNISRISKK